MMNALQQVETDSHQSNWIELGSDPKPSCIDIQQWEHEQTWNNYKRTQTKSEV